MDDSPFNARAMIPVLETSRRRIFGSLVGGTLAGLVGWLETEADRKRRNTHHDRNRKRQRAQSGNTRRGDGKSKQKGGSPALKVLTRNLYLGADLGSLFDLTTVQDLVGAVTQVFAMVQATNFSERAKALADEIAAIDPHLVGLQEVTLWRSGTPAETVEYDFLAILLSELTARGKAYAAVATVQNFDAEAPRLTATGLQHVRITDRDVILARTDLPENVLAIANPQSGTFAAHVTIAVPALPPAPPTLVSTPRGWTAVDVSLHGETIRIVNTHLEPFDLGVQEQQRVEMVTGPLQTTLPTVLLGDLNSPADGGSTYRKMLDEEEFVDAWTTARGNDAGFTWGHAEDLRNPTPALTERIDFVLTRGGMTASSANRVGHEPEDRTPSGLWPSDHVGVWAVLHLTDA